MSEKDEYRIDNPIEKVGFYHWTDPEAIHELQDRQRMYERIADEIRNRKNLSFDRIFQKVKKEEEDKEAASPPPDSTPSPDHSSD